MIRLTSDRRIQTLVSSNLSIEQEHLGEEIVASGLRRLIVSLDGASQGTYQKYRQGGNIELVFNNIQQIILAKKLSGQKSPIIEWQYLVFKHNEHEIPLAYKMARELGVDRIVCRSANFPYDHYSPERNHLLEDEAALWMPSNPKYWEMHPNSYDRHGYLWSGACHFLYPRDEYRSGWECFSLLLRYLQPDRIWKFTIRTAYRNLESSCIPTLAWLVWALAGELSRHDM